MQLHPSNSAADTAAISASGPRTMPHPSPLRRRLLWTAGIAALLLLLLFVPPLVNANRYQRQIVRSMSESLGRPVHLDNVTLHLLPVPGLTLSNLVVSENPAFGDEPTIRANSVEATLRLGSLWRRRVEFSTIRFIEPSVNLVRDAGGRWNLSEVLVHASKVDTAPTAQAHAGPSPRFPYIEATDGRVNIKLAQEKLPISLTDADFALWLPTPNQWRIRLKGQPARTDASINDPGAVRIEGDLQRSTTAAAVPVDLHASWHDVPLGEASRFFTGEDLGWRGTLNLESALSGTLGKGQLRTQLTLNELHRAEFAPANPLDLQIHCEASAAVAAAAVSHLHCTLPDNAPEPMSLTADAVDLGRLGAAPVTIDGTEIPLHWGLLWAALFSPRVPTDLHPAATMEVHLQHLPDAVLQSPGRSPVRSAARGKQHLSPTRQGTSADGGSPSQWTGQVQVHLPAAPALEAPGEEAGSADTRLAPRDAGVTLVWQAGPPPAVANSKSSRSPQSPVTPSPGLAFILQPMSLPIAPSQTLTVGASLTPFGYTLNVSGSASTAAFLIPARYLPQLGDGLSEILPFPPTGLQVSRVDFTCTHPWGSLQTCVALRPTVTQGRTAEGIGAAIVPASGNAPGAGGVPSLLTPHSLSPLDGEQPLGGTPQPAPSNSPHL